MVNIIVPDLGKEKNETGSCSLSRSWSINFNGDFIPTTYKVGDKVVLPTQGFTKLTL